MLTPQDAVTARLQTLGVTETVEFNTPPRPELGDFSTPVALKLAKSRRMPPAAIADDLRSQLSAQLPEFIQTVSVSAPGFLNFFVDAPRYAAALLAAVDAAGDSFGECPLPSDTPTRVLIEHTSVNPNKAMHVGHVRNAVLGDTLVRILRRSGCDVEVCNYIDDTGVQVVDVVTAMLYLEAPVYSHGSSFDPIWEKAPADRPFDHYCWDVYARVQEFLRPDKDPKLPQPPPDKLLRIQDLQQRKQEVMHALEDPDSAIAGFAHELAARILRAHLHIAERLNVFYDLLNWESDILRSGFWDTTFLQLRESGAIKYEDEGPNKGCWVVPLGGVVETKDGPRSLDKILVRSSGVATYTAKDIAYQLWKFGRLGTDFRYRLWGVQRNGEELWSTSPDGEEKPGFGRADRVINVIDVSQSEAQDTVYECLDRLGFQDEAAHSAHRNYEVVTLTPAAAAELGALTEGSGDVAMSGRRGLGVKADALIDHMVRTIRTKNADDTLDAEALAVAAIRYYMLRFSTNTKIRFDFDVASQTTGETGVYLIYSYARACSMLAKAAAADPLNLDLARVAVPDALTPEERSLVNEMGRLPAVVATAAEALTTTPLTTYAFALAAAFTSFYDNTPPILREPDPAIRTFRLCLVAAYRQVMRATLDVMGITPLDRI